MATQANSTLVKAKAGKNDEFYTRIEDIEKELKHYKDHFKGKVVLCNCDDPEWSNFWQFFTLKFDFYEMKKLITTHYVDNGASDKGAYSLEIFKNEDGSFETKKTPLTGNGDFRSDECIEYLKEADIVVTNPPFSLFREYVATLIEHDKQFLIIGNNNAITYKEVFPLLKDNKMWLGVHSNATVTFQLPDHYPRWDKVIDGIKYGKVPAISWFTNLPHEKREKEIDSWKKYNKEDYPTYDNYDAIEVSKVADIPFDYDGAMGVPITFLNNYNPDQFEIIGLDRYVEGNTTPNKRFTIKNKEKYARIVIKHKR